MDLKIGKVKTKHKDAVVKSPLPNILPQHPSRCMFSGNSKSGKSNLMITLIQDERFLKDYFDIIFVFSPSIYIDDAWESIIPDIVHPNHAFDEPTPEVLEKILEIQQNIIQQSNIAQSPKILFIFDDIIDNKTIMHNEALNKIFFRGRHSNISSWIATQSYNMVPRKLRLQMTNVFIFKPQKSEENILAKELTQSGMDEKHFIRLLHHCTKERFSFMHVNLQQPAEKCFRRTLEFVVK